MATHEMPSMQSQSYASSTYDSSSIEAGSYHFGGVPEDAISAIRARRRPNMALNAAAAANLIKEEEDMANTTLRYVQVFLVDPDESIPLDKRMLHKSEPFLTDDDDQSLFFGMNITDLLKKHNEYRTTVQNKKIKDRTEMLEAARIRDLKMTVVNIAAFK